MQPSPQPWFASKRETAVFISIALTGILSSVFTYPKLNGYAYNSGENLAGAFVPPLLAIAYAAYAGCKKGFGNLLLLKTLSLYVIQTAPFFPLFFQVFRPTPLDDFNRYFMYAQNMVEHKTLWGGDKLYFPAAGLHYVTQPGYRYVVAGELLLFGKLYRLVQFINIAIYLVAVFYLQRTVHHRIPALRLRLAIYALLLLSGVFAVKNILMGLPEWFTAVLLFAAAYQYALKNRTALAVALLAFVPFFRQNLLAATLVLFAWVLWHNKRRLRLVAAFVFPLLLPLYHNLYYAGQWRFLVDLFELPFLRPASDGLLNKINTSLLAGNALHYAGLELSGGAVRLLPVGALFLPLAVVVFFALLRRMQRNPKRYWIITVAGAVGPALLLGSGYPPRFEYMNTMFMVAGYFFIERATAK